MITAPPRGYPGVLQLVVREDHDDLSAEMSKTEPTWAATGSPP
jgi:hypothetical protein